MLGVAGEQPITPTTASATGTRLPPTTASATGTRLPPTTASATGTRLQQGDRLMLMPPAAALKATINA